MTSRFACCSSRFAFSRAARARFVSSLRRANSSVADSNRAVFSASAARWSASASSARAVAARVGARARLFLRLLPRLLRLFLQRPAADHRALLAVERASRLRLLPELVDLLELAVAELRRASSALPRLDRLGGFRNRHPRASARSRIALRVSRARSARAPRARSAPRARRARPTTAGTSGTTSRAPSRRRASCWRARFGVGAPRRAPKPRRDRRRAAPTPPPPPPPRERLLCSRGTPVRHTERRWCGSRKRKEVCHTNGGTLFVSAVRSARTPNASFVASFVAAGCSFRLVSSRLVQMGIRGSVATRAARRLRTSRVFGHRPARASLRALRCARSSSRVSGVMVASRSCAWDGAWLGQGGMTKAETDARWLTGRTRAANPGGRRTCSRMRASSLDDKMTGPMAADAAWRRGRGRECALVSGSHSVDVSATTRES